MLPAYESYECSESRVLTTQYRPDHCDGTYDANCDATRDYGNISAILTGFGETELLAYMQTYWKDYQGDDESFWQHEWTKHGTCISTLEPQCYPDHEPTQEVVDFFRKTVELFKALPSYEVRARFPRAFCIRVLLGFGSMG